MIADRETALTALAWTLVSPGAIWLAVRVLGIEPDFAGVQLIAFTPWMALGSLIPIAIAAALRRPAPALTAAAVAIAFALIVLPRAFGGVTEADGGEGASLRIVAANSEFGEADPAALVARARELDADVVVVSELTPRFASRLERAGIVELLPHGEIAAAKSASGTAIYSRLPLSQTRTEALPAGFLMPSGILRLYGADPVEIFGVHAAPPVNVDNWRSDLDALPAATPEIPRILAGDFNATLDHDTFREVLDRGYADAAETLGEGLAMTWPADRRLPALVAIDHVLADDRIGVREFSTHEVPGTDHRVVFAELSLPPAP